MTVVSSAAPPLSPKLNFQLSLMMFLQYGIWGAWLPILFPYMGYLGFKPGESVAIFFVGAVGAIIGPFLAGQFADRYFNTEKFLAVSHILAASWSGSSPAFIPSAPSSSSPCSTA